MKEYLKNMKISFILAAILYIALGIILLLWPGITGAIICFAFGMVFLLYGIITIISFFVHDSHLGSFRFELILGIVALALGILALVRPGVILSVLPVVLGVYIVIDALLNVKRALELHHMEYQRWWVALLLSAISAALGVFILLRPQFIADFLFMVVGGVFLYNGLSDLWSLFMLGQVTKKWRKDHPIEVDPLNIE